MSDSSAIKKYIKDAAVEEENDEEEVEHIEIDWKLIVASIGIFIAAVHLGILIIRYISSFISLDRVIISNNFLYIAIIATVPALSWVIGTDTTFWDFRKRKRLALYAVAFNGTLTILEPVYTLLWTLFVTLCFKIQISPAMTQGMVILLAQLLIVGAYAAILGFVWWVFGHVLFSDEAKEKIDHFKIGHYVDIWENKENQYHARFVKDLETGKTYLIAQADRLIHMVINGASGTGKTSSVFIPQIMADLTQKMKNRIARQMGLLKMVLTHQAFITKHWEGDFKEKYVQPYKKYEKKYHELYETYPDCGITVVAPNNSIIEDIIRLAKARGTKVNVLDPAREYKEYKNVKTCGINPFYVPLGLSERERAIHIIKAAVTFSQVLIAVNESKGSTTDQYFVDINDSVSTNVAIAVMLAKNIEGKQADIIDIQQSIDDFSKLEAYVKTIEAHEKIHIEPPKIKGNGKNNAKNEADLEHFEGVIEEYEKQKNNPSAAKAQQKDARNSPYAQTILYIKQELLGEGREKMFDQARGLRNMIDKLLFDPRIKEILSADEAHRLDFDEMLSDNQITLVNTALEFGQSTSTAFGLFFLLLQRVSVLRRPKEKSLHFLWVDEAPQYMHPVYDEMFTLFRQYKVSVALAIQSLSQTRKVKKTEYLENVFMGAGTHVVFGRLDSDEMKIYSELAGSKEILISQVTRAETSMLSDNPNVTMSERTTPTVKANIEGSEMRQMDFQEIILLTVKKGCPTEGIKGKVSFISKSDFLPVDRKEVDWSRLNPDPDPEEEQEEKGIRPEPVKIETEAVIRPPQSMERTMKQQYEDDEISIDDLTTTEQKVHVDELKNIAAMLFDD